MIKAPLYTAGIIFGLVALAHLYRLIFYFPLVIGTTPVPYGANVLGAILFGALSFWMFFAAHSICCKNQNHRD